MRIHELGVYSCLFYHGGAIRLKESVFSQAGMDIRIPSNENIRAWTLCLCFDPGGHSTRLFNLKGKFDIQASLFLKDLDDLSRCLLVECRIDGKVSGLDHNCRKNQQKQNKRNENSLLHVFPLLLLIGILEKSQPAE